MRYRKWQGFVWVGVVCLSLLAVLQASLVSAAEASPPAVRGATATSATYEQDGGTVTKANQIYTATQTDQSAVHVTGGGVFYLSDSIIETSGNTSSNDNSSFYGLNAAVLADGEDSDAGEIHLTNVAITTTGTGANAAFASGDGSVVSLVDVTIYATGDGGHGVMATLEGEMTLINVDMSTAGKNSGAIATDRGSGTIVVTGGVVQTSGADSPGIYSTGKIDVTGGVITATGSESAVIEGSNYITLTDTLLTSSMVDKWGVFIYQSMSGDAEGAEGVFTMNGGKLANTATTGPLFYVTNATGYITLEDVEVLAASGTLLQAEANSRWGTSGENGGTAYLVATDQALTGDLIADSISAITATLQSGSYLTGSINSDQEASWVSLTLDASSSWDVAADSYLNCLYLPDGLPAALTTPIPNIIGNGYTVYYKASSCSALDGETYSLTDGGYLKPTGSSDTDDYSLFLPLVVRE